MESLSKYPKVTKSVSSRVGDEPRYLAILREGYGPWGKTVKGPAQGEP